MESVIQHEKECFVTGRTDNLHMHHIFFGTANRKLSEKYGYKVWLTAEYHNMSNHGVHFNRELDLKLKRTAQEHFENTTGSREDFIKLFGKNYL